MTNYTALSQNMTNVNTFSDLLLKANEAASGFWTGMWWMVISVIFISSASVFSFEIAALFTLFVGMVSGMFLLYLGLISFVSFGMTEAILLFLVLYLMYSSSRINQ